MNDIQIHDLKTADKGILKEIFKINEGYNPFLGPLESLDNLIELIKRSNYSVFLTNKEQICAFLVSFRENSSYQSKNYEFFKNRFERFFYIDRIGVVESFKNQGLGTFIYNKIDAICIKDKLPICAEVNIVPINEESIKFHEKMGFKKVSEAYSNSNYGVRYYEKCM